MTGMNINPVKLLYKTNFQEFEEWWWNFKILPEIKKIAKITSMWLNPSGFTIFIPLKPIITDFPFAVYEFSRLKIWIGLAWDFTAAMRLDDTQSSQRTQIQKGVEWWGSFIIITMIHSLCFHWGQLHYRTLEDLTIFQGTLRQSWKSFTREVKIYFACFMICWYLADPV